jgi:hypothetical protein
MCAFSLMFCRPGGCMLASMSEIEPRADGPLVDWSDLGVSGLLPTGTVTLLLADVEGSTRLWERSSVGTDASSIPEHPSWHVTGHPHVANLAGQREAVVTLRPIRASRPIGVRGCPCRLRN